MNWLLAYFSIGILFNFLIDLLVDYFEKTGYEDINEMRFNTFTKIVTTIFWPLAILFIIVVIFKNLPR